MPGPRGDFDCLDRACRGKNDPLADPAGVVEGEKYSCPSQHQKYLPRHRVGVAMRSYVCPRLNGHAKALDRVFQDGMNVMMGPPAR